jgi:hypothetical protein
VSAGGIVALTRVDDAAFDRLTKPLLKQLHGLVGENARIEFRNSAGKNW